MGRILVLGILTLAMTALVPSLVPLAAAEAGVNVAEMHDNQGNHKGHDKKDPYCDYQLGAICSPYSGFDCLITSGNVWGGLVGCKFGSTSIACYITFPYCDSHIGLIDNTAG